MMEHTDTAPATFPRPLTRETSSSSPTTNMNRTRPDPGQDLEEPALVDGEEIVAQLHAEQARTEQHASPDLADDRRNPSRDAGMPASRATTMISASCEDHDRYVDR